MRLLLILVQGFKLWLWGLLGGSVFVEYKKLNMLPVSIYYDCRGLAFKLVRYFQSVYRKRRKAETEVNDGMKKSLRRNVKGISTIIATIIIVAIAIVMSIAVAYWAMGIGGSFTRFEKLQFVSAYASDDKTVNLKIKNTGTAPATINSVMINGQPLVGTVLYAYSASAKTGDTNSTSLLNPGDITDGTIGFTTAMQPGTTVEVKLQTAAGNQYPQVVVLP